MTNPLSPANKGPTPQNVNHSQDDNSVPVNIESPTAQLAVDAPSDPDFHPETDRQPLSPLSTSEELNSGVGQDDLQHVAADVHSSATTQQLHKVANISSKSGKAETADTEPLSPLRKPSRRSRLTNIFSNWWTWELLSMLLSILCFLGVIILLAVSNGKGVPELGYGLTLNTIISILVTVSKSAMLVAIGAAIGQRKWFPLTRDRQKLHDIQTIDDASRGPWGSINLIMSFGLQDIVTLGAVVTLLMTIVDPFAQQSVVYPVRTVNVNDDGVFLPQATVYHEPSGDFNDIYQKTVYDGLWNGAPSWNVSCPNGNCTFPPFKSLSWCSECVDATDNVIMTGDGMNIDFLHPLNVSAGYENYDWAQADYVLTVDMETFLVDQPLSTYNAGELQIELVESSNLQAFLHVPISHVWAPTIHKWEVGVEARRLSNLWRPATSLAHVDLDYDRFTPFKNVTVKRASICALNPCLREYTIRVNAGRVETTILRTEYGAFASSVPGFSTVSLSDNPVCWVSNYTSVSSASANPTIPSSLPPGKSFCDQGVDQWTICDVDTTFIICDFDAVRQAQIVQDALLGNKSEISCLQGPNSSFFSIDKTHNPVHVANASQGDNIIRLSYIPPWSLRSSYDEESYQSPAYRHVLYGQNGSSLERTLEDIAASLTVALQSQAGANPDGARIFGQTAVIEAYVHVRWLWIIYPAVILSMGILFVGWTIVATSVAASPSIAGPDIGYGKRLWKSSTLALIYHGPTNLSPESRNEARDIATMENMAKRTTVRYERGEMLIAEEEDNHFMVP